MSLTDQVNPKEKTYNASVEPSINGINSDESLLILSEEDLKAAINYLSKYHHLNSEKLPGEISNKLDLLRLTISLLKEKKNNSYYETVANIIENQFRPTVIEDGTIGAYLFGCYQQDYGDIDEKCSISCLKSFNPDINHTTCNRQLWIQRSEKLHPDNIRFSLYHNGLVSNSDNSSLPPQGIVFVKKTWAGFTSREIHLFSKNHLDEAEIMIKEGNKYRRILPSTKVNKLPKLRGVLPSPRGIALEVPELYQERPQISPIINRLDNSNSPFNFPVEVQTKGSYRDDSWEMNKSDRIDSEEVFTPSSKPESVRPWNSQESSQNNTLWLIIIIIVILILIIIVFLISRR